VLVGGGGERKTLRLVAQYADTCNVFATTPEEVGRKLAVLDAHCADLGRDPATIERTLLMGGDPLADVDAFVDTLAAYAAVGVQAVWLNAPGPQCADWVAELGTTLVPRAAAL
jgi:hypothetical protein